MKGFSFAVLTLLTCTVASAAVNPLPLLFEQTHSGAVARVPGGAVAISANGALLQTAQGSVALNLENARSVAPVAEKPLTSTSNYMTGPDRSKWRLGVPHFGQVRSRGIYPGIDIVYYGSDGHLEYDFVVSPGANPDRIALRFDGAKKLSTDPDGNLIIDTGSTTIRQLRPLVYQESGRKIEARYRIVSSNRVRFDVPDWDRRKALVIDPVIQYSRYLGREGQESAIAVASDASGNAIYVGETTSDQFAFGSVWKSDRTGDSDVFVAKLGASGAVQFITYLGGHGPDTARAVATDASGNIYLTGTTNSADFPARNALNVKYSGGRLCTEAEPCNFDGFVAKLSSSGTDLLFSTYLGGTGYDFPDGVALDPSGSLWVGGWTNSPDFPVRGGFQSGPAGGGGDIFVTEIDTNRGQILYSSYIGGSGDDIAGGLAVDSRGLVYVTGSTTVGVFPLSNATQSRNAGKQDAFLFVLDPDRNDLVFSTLFGGSGDDVGVKVAVDAAGSAYVTGYTDSANLPVTTGGAPRGRTDIFVARFTAPRLDWATYAGGSGDDFPGAIAVDPAGSAYVAGWTNSSNFPTRGAIQSTYMGGNFTSQQYDGVVMRISPGGDNVLFSSYLGGTGEDKFYGIALDGSLNILLAGSTTSANLPAAANTFGSSSASLFDGTALKLSADASITLIAANPGRLTLTARSTDTQSVNTTIALTTTTGTATFSTTTTATWLRADPVSGTAPSNIVISVNPLNLSPGVNQGEVVIQSSGNTFRIPVSVTQITLPVISSANPATLVRGSGDTVVTITGSGFSQGAQVQANGTGLQTTFVDARTLRATIPTYLLQSDQSLGLVVVNPDGGRSSALAVPVGAAGPIFTPGGIVHGATQIGGGPIAPGEVLVLYGNPFGPAALTLGGASNGVYGTSLAGVRVLFDDIAAPVLWATSGSAAVAVPYTVASGTNTSVVLEFNGQRSQPVRVPVQASNPGLFTANQTGRGQAAALNQDGSYNLPGSPAERGSVISFFGTGEGIVSPAPASGSLVPVNSPTQITQQVQVLIGGIPATIQYAGGAPGLISGVFQINAVVPANAQTGNGIPVTVRIGEFTSPENAVTVSIR